MVVSKVGNKQLLRKTYYFWVGAKGAEGPSVGGSMYGIFTYSWLIFSGKGRYIYRIPYMGAMGYNSWLI